METITSVTSLKNAIQLLEIEQVAKGEMLKEQFYLTYESLKPVNILKNTLKEIVSSPSLIENTLGAAIGLTTGYLSKKVVVGSSGNIIRKLLGSILQFSVTNLVAQHPEGIKTIGQSIIRYFIGNKEERKTHEQDE